MILPFIQYGVGNVEKILSKTTLNNFWYLVFNQESYCSGKVV